MKGTTRHPVDQWREETSGLYFIVSPRYRSILSVLQLRLAVQLTEDEKREPFSLGEITQLISSHSL